MTFYGTEFELSDIVSWTHGEILMYWYVHDTKFTVLQCSGRFMVQVFHDTSSVAIYIHIIIGIL